MEQLPVRYNRDAVMPDVYVRSIHQRIPRGKLQVTGTSIGNKNAPVSRGECDCDMPCFGMHSPEAMGIRIDQ